MSKARRRSNSSVDHGAQLGFKSKFETVEQEPVFEEDVHGDGGVDHYVDEHAEAIDGGKLDKHSSAESSVSSIEEEGPNEGKM